MLSAELAEAGRDDTEAYAMCHSAQLIGGEYLMEMYDFDEYRLSAIAACVAELTYDALVNISRLVDNIAAADILFISRHVTISSLSTLIISTPRRRPMRSMSAPSLLPEIFDAYASLFRRLLRCYAIHFGALCLFLAADFSPRLMPRCRHDI